MICVTSKAQRHGLQPMDTQCIERPNHTVEGDILTHLTLLIYLRDLLLITYDRMANL